MRTRCGLLRRRTSGKERREQYEFVDSVVLNDHLQNQIFFFSVGGSLCSQLPSMLVVGDSLPLFISQQQNWICFGVCGSDNEIDESWTLLRSALAFTGLSVASHASPRRTGATASTNNLFGIKLFSGLIYFENQKRICTGSKIGRVSQFAAGESVGECVRGGRARRELSLTVARLPNASIIGESTESCYENDKVFFLPSFLSFVVSPSLSLPFVRTQFIRTSFFAPEALNSFR